MAKKIFVFVEGHEMEGRAFFPTRDVVKIPILFSELEKLERVSPQTIYHGKLARTLKIQLGIDPRCWRCLEKAGCICIDCEKEE
jgi:hypothetical protein